jgi:16S rRNA processing protein RimM
MATRRRRRDARTAIAAAARPGAQSHDGSIVAMGEVAGAYGVRGWMKVKPFTEEPQALLGYRTWWLQRKGGGEWRPVELHDGRAHSNSVVAQVAGVDSRETAMQLKGALVGVPRAELPPASGDEIYHADLVGLDVLNREGERLGRVAAVEEFGAHPVLRVVHEQGARTLIPFVPAYVDGVDLATGRIDVDWQADY